MPATIPSNRPFAAGSALSRTFAAWGATLPTLLLLAVVVDAPMILWQWAARDDAASGRWTLQSVVQHLVDVVLAGTCIHVIFKRLVGEPIRFGDALSSGFRKIVPLVINGVLVALMTAVGAFPLLFVEDLDGGVVLLVVAVVAVVAAIVTTLTVAGPGAIVVEDAGPARAIARSFALTRGHRMAIFLGMIVIGVVAWLIGLLGEFVAEAATSAAVPAGFALRTGFVLLTDTLGAAYAAVVYHDLRAAKEGVDARELLRVFS